uniref:Uncharacterized protein n=1 Tax=Oryza meridionalis TaxID=40149 RepID=A0A0E0DQV3_9ORYZ
MEKGSSSTPSAANTSEPMMTGPSAAAENASLAISSELVLVHRGHATAATARRRRARRRQCGGSDEGAVF